MMKGGLVGGVPKMPCSINEHQLTGVCTLLMASTGPAVLSTRNDSWLVVSAKDPQALESLLQ
jgi:hypothetical protein